MLTDTTKFPINDLCQAFLKMSQKFLIISTGFSGAF